MTVYMHEILKYTDFILEEYRDNIGEINLTELEEHLQDYFNLSDKEVDNADLSFKLFKHLEKEGKLEDDNRSKTERRSY